MDNAVWYDEYLVANNGDGTMTALHSATSAGDLENIEELSLGGLLMRPEGVSGLAVFSLNITDEPVKMGVIHPAGECKEVRR